MKFSEITPEMIQDWKAQKGADSLSQVDIKYCAKKNEDGEDVKTKTASFIICTPTRTVMDVIAQHGLAKDVAKANKALISNCVLGGDMDAIEQDGGVYTSLLTKLNIKTTDYEASIKKL